jgi:trimeric autotransporter adhesin
LRLAASSTAVLSTGILLAASVVAIWMPSRGYAAECNAAASANGGSDGGKAANTACGQNAQAVGDFGTAIGVESKAVEHAATAVGARAAAGGQFSTAIGADAHASGDGGTATGNLAKALGTFSSAFGTAAEASGFAASAYGFGAVAEGASSTAVGRAAKAPGEGGSTFGSFAEASGFAASAYGSHAVAKGDESTAVGWTAVASGSGASAYGANAFATGDKSTAVGNDARAEADRSTAIGTGAKATKADQMAIGTKDNTYTTPGITSDLSRSRQSGPLEVVTSDAGGNLASDGGFIFKQLKEAREGIAIAMALHDPDLVAGEKFGVRLNWGNFEGSNALALTAAGVIGTDVLTSGDRLAVSGGVGYGVDQNTLGARVGVQMTWK